MAECILLKKDNDSFIKVNDWSKTISMVFTEFSEHANYHDIYLYQSNIKQNQTGQTTNYANYTTIDDSGLGNYINYNTIFFIF